MHTDDQPVTGLNATPSTGAGAAGKGRLRGPSREDSEVGLRQMSWVVAMIVPR